MIFSNLGVSVHMPRSTRLQRRECWTLTLRVSCWIMANNNGYDSLALLRTLADVAHFLDWSKEFDS